MSESCCIYHLISNHILNDLEKGIYVIGFSYPVVPKGKARIRVQLSAAHSTEDVNQLVDAFIEVGIKLGVIIAWFVKL